MKYINEEGALVIKSWCNEPEEGAIEQARNLARLPFAFKQICLMPDTHQGYGMPIGGVLATENVVIPNAVGVDIGCGMIATQTNISHLSTDTLKVIMGKIRGRIPVGFNKHSTPQDSGSLNSAKCGDIVASEYKKALCSLGTLGGGNHFIEIQRDVEDGFIWIMVHSGSRNLGKLVAEHYDNLAFKMNRKYHSMISPEWQLAFLPLLNDDLGNQYLKDMQFCVDFALANRQLMMTRIQEIFNEELCNCAFLNTVNIAHNYARMEHHFGKNVMIHRKGATSAREGELGIIPGSQGTASYIVKGKGNKESFESCSHGAGRVMSRKKAVSTLDLEHEKKLLDDRGIIHAIRNKDDLEEASSAYKSIDVVMEEQRDLVDIVVKLEPLAVIKG